MPVYDYKCQTHGLFYALATLEESAEPKPCPDCQALSARVIMIAPQILGQNPANNAAHSRNERSRHAPRFSNPEERREDLARREHRHGKGCGCGQESINRSKLFYTADGKKMFPSMRPWMISH